MKLSAHVMETVRRENGLPLYPIESWVSLPDDNGHTHCWGCGRTISTGDRCVGRHFVYNSVSFCPTCVADTPDVMRAWVASAPQG